TLETDRLIGSYVSIARPDEYPSYHRRHYGRYWRPGDCRGNQPTVMAARPDGLAPAARRHIDAVGNHQYTHPYPIAAAAYRNRHNRPRHQGAGRDRHLHAGRHGHP